MTEGTATTARGFLAAALLLAAACTKTPAPAPPADGLAAPRSISGGEARAIIEADSRAVLLDVRTPAEFASGHAAGARLIPHDEVRARAASELPDRDAPIVLYCRSGRRSGLAASALVELGYTRVYDFGPLSAWTGEIVASGS